MTSRMTYDDNIPYQLRGHYLKKLCDATTLGNRISKNRTLYIVGRHCGISQGCGRQQQTGCLFTLLWQSGGVKSLKLLISYGVDVRT